MSYKKEDFLEMSNSMGTSVLINVSKIRFVTKSKSQPGLCKFFFGGGEDDYILVKTTFEEFVELL